MAVGFGLFAIEHTDGQAVIRDQFVLDSPLLRELAEAINARPDQPEDSSLDWYDGLDHYGEAIDPEACYEPDEVLRGLQWFNTLADRGDPSVQQLWGRARTSEPYSAAAFRRTFASELSGLMSLCARARQRGHLVVGMFIS